MNGAVCPKSGLLSNEPRWIGSRVSMEASAQHSQLDCLDYAHSADTTAICLESVHLAHRDSIGGSAATTRILYSRVACIFKGRNYPNKPVCYLQYCGGNQTVCRRPDKTGRNGVFWVATQFAHHELICWCSHGRSQREHVTWSVSESSHDLELDSALGE